MSVDKKTYVQQLGMLLDCAVAEIKGDIQQPEYADRLREQIRAVGVSAGKQFSLDVMTEIAEDAADLVEKDWGLRIDIVDKAWDEVEDKNGSRWFA